MLQALLLAVALWPLFWLVVPRAARKDTLALASVVALALYDVRLPLLVLVVVVAVWVTTRSIGAANRRHSRWIVIGAFAALAGLFFDNKLRSVSGMATALASQGGVAFIGVSYFVLKAASVVIEVNRRTLEAPDLRRLARWLVFFPIFTSGPIEAFKHFDDQLPRIDAERVRTGLERVLFGCVRALVFSRYLAEWSTPIIQSPEGHAPLLLVLAGLAASLRIYFDFAGYSDIAIGVSALYGYEIQENFDRPLARRNISSLWQHWHMTLTGWLRVYVFTPWTRTLMKRGRRWHTPAIVSGQIVTMVFCGLWHAPTAAFVLWGALHGLAMTTASLWARNLGRRLPAGLVSWWRASPLAWGASVALTLFTFAAINVLAVTDLATALRFYRSVCEGLLAGS